MRSPHCSITRRAFSTGAALSIAAALRSTPAAAQQSGRARKKPPNILFILADDLGWADLSSYGRPDYRIPVLDRLGQHGIG